MQIGKFEDFLKARVKVEGKPGNIGKNVSLIFFYNLVKYVPFLILINLGCNLLQQDQDQR